MEAITQDEEEENIVLGTAKVEDLQHVCDGKIHDIALDLQGYRLSNLSEALHL